VILRGLMMWKTMSQRMSYVLLDFRIPHKTLRALTTVKRMHRGHAALRRPREQY